MAKIEIIKDVEPCGKVYFLVKVDRWCQGACKTLEEAECLAKKCEENIRCEKVGQTIVSSKCV